MKIQVTNLKKGCFAFVVVFIMANLLLVTSSFAQTFKPEKVIKPLYFDQSQALRDITPIAPGTRKQGWKDGEIENELDLKEELLEESLWTGQDPVLQDYIPGSRSNPIIDQNHDGVSNLSGVAPPDTDGDVGPDHYFQMINLSFAIWDKDGNLLYGPADNSTIWDGFSGPWSGTNDGDPVVLYDEYADRWLVSQFSLPNYPNGPYYELVAVSQTGDPTGAWYRYAYEFSDMPDYPKFGIWPDGYYFTINQFANGSSWAGAGVCALDRDAMITGDATAEMQFFDLGTSYGSLLPADCDGATLPPAGSPAYFTELNSNSLRIFQAQIDWDNSNNSSVTVLQNLTTQPFSTSNINIQQPGTSTALMAISDRLMYRLQYRNFGSYQVMLTNHTVNADGNGQAGVRWYELRNYGSGWSIYQQGTYAPDDGDGRWMASIAMNGDGDIALGYSVSSSSTYPSIRFAGQNAESTGTGILDIPETTIFDGTASQTGISRWGDYSAMTVDPSDDQSFWFTTEYSTGGWNWRTRIASFSYAPITEPPVADFSADDTHPMVGQTVSFMDESTNVPGSWSWTFSPSTVTFVEGTNAGSKNPKVQFNASGFYTVTLVATNDIGSDTETKTNYIETLDCSAVNVYPYEENFDEWAVSAPEMSCTADGSVDLDDCWVNTTGDDIDWDVYTSNTPSGETGPDEDHTSGNGNYIYTESSNCFNHTGLVSTPSFDLSSLSNPELHFWYYMYGAEIGTLSVQASVDGGTTWSADLWSLSGDQGQEWFEAVVSLSGYASETDVMFRFTGATGDNWHSDIALDDFSVTGGAGGTPPTANAGDDQTICESSTCQLDGSAYNSSSIEWSTSGDGVFSDVNDPEAIYTPGTQDINNGSVIITLTAFPIPPATSTSTDDMTLNIEQEPVADAGTTGETCEGVSFTVSDASASNYSSLLWTTDGTGTLTDAATLTPTYTPADGETGQITLTLTAQGLADCPETSSQMTLNVIIGPTADAGSDGYTCEDFSYTVDGASATNYSSLLWTENGAGYLLNETTLSPTYVPGTGETGTVTLTLTAHSQGSCSDAVSDMQIEIFPEPTAYAGSDEQTCEGTPYMVTDASATNGSSVLWTTDGQGTITNETTLTPTYTPASGETGDVVLTLTVFGQGTCNDATSYKTVTYLASPTAYAGVDIETCEGNNYTVTDATAENYSSISWTENGTGYLTNANTLTPTYIPGNDETGVVTLTLTAQGQAGCADAVSTKQIEYFAEPFADAGPDEMTCAGTSFTISGASAADYSSLSWTEDGTGYLTDANTLTPTYVPGDDEEGIVTLTLTAEGLADCGSTASSMQLEIIGGASAYAGSDAYTCEDVSYTITDASAENYSTALWTTNGLGTILDETTLTPTYVPAQGETGVITMILTVQSEGGGMCGSAGSSMTLEIIPAPEADAGGDDMSCQNDTYTVSGATASENSTVLWTENGNGTLTDETTLTPTYIPATDETGIVTLTLTVTSGNGGFCGDAVSSMDLDIIPGATADAGDDDIICEDESYTVTGASASDNSTYLWTTDGAGTLSDATTLTPTYTPATGETGIVTLTLTVTSGGGGYCGTAESYMNLEIMPQPFADAGPDGEVCQNDSYTVTGASASSNSTLLWTTNGTGQLTDINTLTPTYTPGSGETGDITLTLTVISGNGGMCGSASSFMTLEILPSAYADAGADGETCEETAFTVTGASASDNSTYLWTTDGTGTLTDATTLTPTYTPATDETGAVTLTLTVESGNGGMCGTATSTMSLEVYPEAYADAGQNDISCQNETYTITGAVASENSTILWTTNGLGTLEDETTISPTYYPDPDEVGEITFTLTVTSVNNGMCGTATSSMTLDIIPGATADAGPDGETCEEEIFTVTGASASSNSTILWTTTGNGVLTGETTLTPSYTPAVGETGDITLTMTVESGGGDCGTATSDMNLFIYPTPYADAGDDGESCQGEAYTITGASASDYSTYLWTTDGQGTLTEETTLTPTYIPDMEETGIVTFTLTVTSGNNGACGTDASSCTVDIIPGATAYAGPDAAVCQSESYTVSGATASENSTILWTTSGAGILSGETTLTPTYTPAEDETGDVTLTLTVTSGSGGMCGEAASSMTLTINGYPVADAGEEIIICESDVAQLDGYAENYVSVQWETFGDGSFNDPTLLDAIYYPGTADIESGSVKLVLTANSATCDPVSDETNLTITLQAYTDAGEDDEICDDETFQTSGYVENTQTFIWTSNGDGTFDDPTSLEAVYTPGAEDAYIGSVTLSLTGFSNEPCENSYTDNMVLTIETCTGVQIGEDQHVDFKIMPNPAYDYVRFSVDNLSGDYAEVLLMDMMGKVVQTEKFEIRNNFIAGRLVLVGLNQGVYFVRIVSDEYEDAVRLIKLK